MKSRRREGMRGGQRKGEGGRRRGEERRGACMQAKWSKKKNRESGVKARKPFKWLVKKHEGKDARQILD